MVEARRDGASPSSTIGRLSARRADLVGGEGERREDDAVDDVRAHALEDDALGVGIPARHVEQDDEAERGRITEEAAALGFIVLLDVTGGDADAERVVLEGMRSHVIDGVIFSPLALSADEIARRADSLPMVLLGERPVPTGFDHIAVNSVAASRAATEHLVAQGRRRIAAVGRESVKGTASARLRGYRQALKAADLPYDTALVIEVPHFERADGHVAMQRLLDLPEPPDAVFCFNDLMAIGALRACVEAGVRVPEEVAIVGFDDIAETRYSNPTVTTISPDLTGLARAALELLSRRIDGDDGPAEDVEVAWTLEARETTLGVRRQSGSGGRGRTGGAPTSQPRA